MFKKLKLFFLLSLVGLFYFNSFGLVLPPIVNSGGGLSIISATNSLTGQITYTPSSITNISSSFTIVLHTNLSATIYTNGVASPPTTISFPASTTAGWNEVQSLFKTSTNNPFAGSRIQIDAGLFKFTTQLLITNTCWISGAGPSATIFRYVGSTNLATISQITNILAGISGDACTMRAAPYSLLYCSTNLEDQGGLERHDPYNIILENLTIQTSTNMPCIGITVSGGDHTVLNSVFSAGPELWTIPSYYSGFFDFDMVPVSSSMIGFIIGGNQPLLNHCRAVAVADGLVPLGDSFLTVYDFNAIVIGNYAGLDEATPYPATCEFSLMSGILVPKISQCEFLSINHILFFDNINDIYVGESSLQMTLNEWRDQNELFQPNNIEIWRGSSTYPIIQITGTSDAITIQAYTNDITGFIVNNSASAYVTYNKLNQDGLWSMSDGHNVTFQEDRNGIFWSGIVNNNIQTVSGRKFIGDGAGLTNILGNTLLITATNRLVFSSVSSLTNTLGREATAIVTAGTSVALQDTNGVSIATIGTVATLDILIPMHVNMRLSGTGVSAILY